MDHQWHYNRLVETRKDRIPEKGKYYEKHHIVMRSMGGSDDEDNLVTLTPREHILAHWLLWRIHRNRQAAGAFFAMTAFMSSKRKNNCYYSFSLYEEAKLAHLSSQKEYHKNMSDEQRAAYCLMRKKGALQKRLNGTVYNNRGATKSNTTVYTCPHCNQSGKGNIFKRWHFDYCRSLENPIEDKNRIKFAENRANYNKTLVTCPNCDQEGMGPSFYRWHFDNCRIVGGSPNMGNRNPEIWKNSLAKINSKEYTCPYCKNTGKGNGFKGHHFERCKHKPTQLL